MKRLQLFFKRMFSFIWRKNARKSQNHAISSVEKRYVEIKCKRRRYWKPKKYVLV
ncbi:hypothetical protein [Capnocytophaga canis]|uniref:hypothetical protein n=1 Tax=Capnocytophaga canis TaxID=1848903 RepID=UPI001BB3D8E1|nr:hypothetical protein [Capnocytophaga canis]